MDLRRLGSSGPLICPLGLGTVKLGRNEAVKYPQGFDLPDDAAALALLQAAADLGINLLDTAPAYGVAEARLGRLLPQLRGWDRRQWVIVTKAGEWFSDGQSRFDFSGPAIRASVLASLDALRMREIDVVLLHSDGVDEAGGRFDAAWDALAGLKAEGLVRQIGFSGKTVAGNHKFAGCADVLMVTYNEAETDQVPVIVKAAERGCGILIKKALASGHVQDPGAGLRRALAMPGVSGAVVGTLSPAHLRANMQAVQGAGDDRTQ